MKRGLILILIILFIGGVSAETHRYYNIERNEIVSEMIDPITQKPNLQLTTQHMASALNTNEVWSQIPTDLRVRSYDDVAQAMASKIDANKLTEKSELKDKIVKQSGQQMMSALTGHQSKKKQVIKDIYRDKGISVNFKSGFDSDCKFKDFSLTKGHRALDYYGTEIQLKKDFNSVEMDEKKITFSENNEYFSLINNKDSQGTLAHKPDSGLFGKGNSDFQKILSSIEKSFNLVNSVVSGFKTDKNDKGKSSLEQTSQGDVEIKLKEGSEMRVENNEEVLLSQINENKESISLLKQGKLNEIHVSENTIVSYPNAIVEVLENAPDTKILNDFELRDSYSIKNSITGFSVFPNENQFVEFSEQNLNIEGEKIIVSIFKSFNNAKINGDKLRIINSETKIDFYEENTYYPRRIKEKSHNIHFIKNELDTKNHFYLRNYKDENNFLIDIDKRISVGDKLINHPYFKDVKIARIRDKMYLENYKKIDFLN